MIKFDAIKKDAKKLQNDTSIYGIKSVYGTLDGAVNVYSTIKSYFDFSHCTESQSVSFDAMHEWITTPVGLAVTLSSSLFFMAFANRANVYEKQSLGRTWKYLREGLQASRNAFKGVRGTILTTALFTTADLRYLILPTTLGLGTVYVANRLLMLGIKAERDKKVKANESLFAHLMNYGAFIECSHTLTFAQLKEKKLSNKFVFLNQGKEKKFIYIDNHHEIKAVTNRYVLYKVSPEQKEQLYYIDHKGRVDLIPDADISAIREELAKNPDSLHLSLLQLNELLPSGIAQFHFNQLKKQNISTQPPARKTLYLLLKGFNGFIDGMYLYLGILGLVALSPQGLLFGLILSTLYCLLCIASRVYEEYQSQQNLTISEYKAELALSGKELELLLIQLNEIALKIALEKDEEVLKKLKIEQKRIDELLDKQVKHFDKLRRSLKKEYQLSHFEIFLLGIKHALPFYGSLVSAVFTLAFICFLAGATLSPPVVLACIAAGIPILIIGIAHAFLTRKPKIIDEKQEQQNTADLAKKIGDVKASLKITKAEAEKADIFTRRAYAKNAIISAIAQCLQADPLADTFYADFAEVIRSFWAGILKGRKEIELLLNPMQQMNEQGHYQDSHFMNFFIIPAAILYSIVFAIKAFAKGFSRTTLTENNDTYNHYKVKETTLESLKASIMKAEESPKPPEQKEHPSSKSSNNQPPSIQQPVNQTVPSNTNPNPSQTSGLAKLGLFRTPSTPRLAIKDANAGTVLDLNLYHYTF